MTVFVFTALYFMVVFGYVHMDIWCVIMFRYVCTDVLSGDGWVCAY